MRFHVEFNRGDGRIVIEADSSNELLESFEGIKPVLDQMSLLSIPDSSQSMPAASRSGITESSTEILRRSRASSINDKIVLLVYYMWKSGRAEKVNIFDLKAIFREVLEVPPKNFTAFMNYLSSKGFATLAGKKDNLKAWSITSNGLAFVEETLLGMERKPKPAKQKTLDPVAFSSDEQD